MFSIPIQVARLVHFHKIHVVTAWRVYFSLSQKQLAERSGFSLEIIETIECSNLHMQPNITRTLSKTIGVESEAIKIRFLNIIH